MTKDIKIQNDASVQEYVKVFESIKADILQTQIKAAMAISAELTMLYWRIGKTLSEKIEHEGWGTKVVDQLAKDLESAFPGLAGFSLRNLRYMKTFAQVYVDINFATAVAKLPWGHNIALLERLSDNNQRLWYAQQTIENGWSRSTLDSWIKSGAYGRQGNAIINFQATPTAW